MQQNLSNFCFKNKQQQHQKEENKKKLQAKKKHNNTFSMWWFKCDFVRTILDKKNIDLFSFISKLISIHLNSPLIQILKTKKKKKEI